MRLLTTFSVALVVSSGVLNMTTSLVMIRGLAEPVAGISSARI